MVTGKTLLILALAIFLLVLVFVIMSFKGSLVEAPVALTFEECASRGFKIIAETPRRCITPEGISFVEGGESAASPEEPESTSPPATAPEDGVSACVVGGCSGQLCVEEGDPGMSTCEYRSEYACYKSAVCKRQQSGQCGWTETAELAACLSNPLPAE